VGQKEGGFREGKTGKLERDGERVSVENVRSQDAELKRARKGVRHNRARKATVRRDERTPEGFTEGEPS